MQYSIHNTTTPVEWSNIAVECSRVQHYLHNIIDTTAAVQCNMHNNISSNTHDQQDQDLGNFVPFGNKFQGR